MPQLCRNSESSVASVAVIDAQGMAKAKMLLVSILFASRRQHAHVHTEFLCQPVRSVSRSSGFRLFPARHNWRLRSDEKGFRRFRHVGFSGVGLSVLGY